MSAPLARFEAGGVRQFTANYSSAPTTTPYLALYVGSGNATLVSCATASTSDSTHFYRFVTLPESRTLYTALWVASFTAGPVVQAFNFQVVKHTS
jgi:hypothetical protein